MESDTLIENKCSWADITCLLLWTCFVQWEVACMSRFISSAHFPGTRRGSSQTLEICDGNRTRRYGRTCKLIARFTFTRNRFAVLTFSTNQNTTHSWQKIKYKMSPRYDLLDGWFDDCFLLRWNSFSSSAARQRPINFRSASSSMPASRSRALSSFSSTNRSNS